MKKILIYVFTSIIILTMIVGCATEPTSAPTTESEPPAAEPVSPTAEPTQPPTDVPVSPTAEPTLEPIEPMSFHFSFDNEPPGIDPGISQGSVQSTIYAALYDGLVSVDESGNIIPSSAEKWEISDDGLEYTFHLRDGLMWSDGKPLTANDFVYSWLRVLNPETASTYSWFVEMFIKNGTEYAQGTVGAEEVGVKATDDKTLVVTLKFPASYFMQALLTGCWMPVRQDVVEADPEKWPFNAETAISNGPYKLTEYKIGSYITAVKNEYYWDADSVKIDDLKFSFITDVNTAYSAFLAGDVDAINSVPPTEFVNILKSDDRLHTYDQLRISFLRLNNKSVGLDNVNVRRAINLAFDRQAYLDGLGIITAKPLLGNVPGGLYLDGQEFRAVSGDNGLMETAQIEEAQKLLADAGYPNGEGLPVYRLHCADTMVKNAEIVQQMLLTNLGIQTEILPVDTKLNFPMMVEGQYDIAFGGWGGDYNHPMTFFDLFTSYAYDNATGWANSEYDSLVEQARVATDEAVQLDLLVQAEHILMDESPIVPLYVPSGAMMMQNNITNWFITPSDTLYIARAEVAQ